MSEDIHKWTRGRYTLMFDEHTFFVWDNVKEERMTALEVTKRLNEQQAIINELKAQLREKEQDEQLYANKIVKLNKEAKEVLDFKSLGGDY